jgi:hypothetical protein
VVYVLRTVLTRSCSTNDIESVRVRHQLSARRERRVQRANAGQPSLREFQTPATDQFECTNRRIVAGSETPPVGAETDDRRVRTSPCSRDAERERGDDRRRESGVRRNAGAQSIVRFNELVARATRPPPGFIGIS